MKPGVCYSLLLYLIFSSVIAVAADTTPSVNVYGRLHFVLANVEDKNTSLNTAGHRIGLKGEGKLNSGLGYFYKLETEYTNDNNFGRKDGLGGNSTSSSANAGTDLADVRVRHANVGLKGKQGSITIGRQDNPVNSTYVANVFEANSGAYLQTPYRMGHAIVFRMKKVSGVKSYVGAILEGGKSDDTDEQNLNAVMFGGSYSWADIKINGGYFSADYDLKSPDDVNTAAANDPVDTKTEFTNWSIGVSYFMNEIYMAINLEGSSEDKDGVTTDTDVIDIALTYTRDSVVYGVGYASADEEGVKKNRILLGAYINLGGNNDCYFETGQYNKEDGGGDNFVMGYRIKF